MNQTYKTSKTVLGETSNNALLFMLMAIAVSYTLFRYIIFGPVSPEHLPSYLFNKAASMMSLLTLAVAAQAFHRKNIEAVKYWGTISLHCVVLHILFSLILLGSNYYPKFFAEAKMNLKGELIMLFGTLATYCYWRLSRPDSALNQNKIKILQLLAALFVGAHLFTMGYAGWLTPHKWHGGMPPISLVSFALAIFALVRFSGENLLDNEKSNTLKRTIGK